jgi:hypothetical protein
LLALLESLLGQVRLIFVEVVPVGAQSVQQYDDLSCVLSVSGAIRHSYMQGDQLAVARVVLPLGLATLAQLSVASAEAEDLARLVSVVSVVSVMSVVSVVSAVSTQNDSPIWIE